MAKNNLTVRAVTHESQKIPDKTIAEAKAFVTIQVPYLIGPHRDKKWIANMDQTPVYFSMTPRTTVESRGARTVINLIVFNGPMLEPSLPPYSPRTKISCYLETSTTQQRSTLSSFALLCLAIFFRFIP